MTIVNPERNLPVITLSYSACKSRSRGRQIDGQIIHTNKIVIFTGDPADRGEIKWGSNCFSCLWNKAPIKPPLMQLASLKPLQDLHCFNYTDGKWKLSRAALIQHNIRGIRLILLLSCCGCFVFFCSLCHVRDSFVLIVWFLLMPRWVYFNWNHWAFWTRSSYLQKYS